MSQAQKWTVPLYRLLLFHQQQVDSCGMLLYNAIDKLNGGSKHLTVH